MLRERKRRGRVFFFTQHNKQASSKLVGDNRRYWKTETMQTQGSTSRSDKKVTEEVTGHGLRKKKGGTNRRGGCRGGREGEREKERDAREQISGAATVNVPSPTVRTCPTAQAHHVLRSQNNNMMSPKRKG